MKQRIGFFVLVSLFVIACTAFAALEQQMNTLSPLREGDVLRIKVMNNRSLVEIDQDVTVNANLDIDV
ncbi:MAG TPA: hypothetical protein PKO06_18510, partial [Candidatus Ozemobacteraceae bacterium]|nr:hypothetical protein [Candidatus Ozemobacteraceae bacterium]